METFITMKSIHNPVKNASPQTHLATSIVQRCIEGSNLAVRGYHICTDKFFTTPELTRSVGELWNSCMWCLIATTWKDKKSVYVLSTIHDLYMLHRLSMKLMLKVSSVGCI